MNSKKIAELLKDAMENQDIDAVWFAIGELEKVETEATHAEQFANDWLLVAENDQDTYLSLLEQEGDTMSSISDNLREEWEQLAEQVSELVEENISPIAGQFIAQMLQGQGARPFDIIARRVLEMKAGVSA